MQKNYIQAIHFNKSVSTLQSYVKFSGYTVYNFQKYLWVFYKSIVTWLKDLCEDSYKTYVPQFKENQKQDIC